MTVIDGLINTWDFKDRLVAVENASMRAHYTYDYTDRRITKQVFTTTNGVAPASPTLTTLYIDKYFEVRDHDAPVKYVWNGNTRVARVTGSLNSSQRVQRVRLWPGYNLISVAVGGAGVPASPQISAAYLWNPGTLNWQTVATGTTLAAGSVMWVQAATNDVLTFTGNYPDPTNSPVAGGPNFLPVPGLETLDLSTNNSQLSTNQWHYDAQNQLWQMALAVPLTNFNSLPTTLAPGEVLFVRADAATQLTPTDPTLRARYYHQDHLGSTSVVADSNGQIVEENSSFAFGFPRQQIRTRNLSESYVFSQKEHDAESSLSYFEARYYFESVARFTRPDPLAEVSKVAWLLDPQKFNLYAYCLNRAIVLIDPNGLASESYDDQTKTGGSRAWRNNNPGNIEYGQKAADLGAVRRESGSGGRFAVFPTEEAGMDALKGLLSSDKYGSLTPKDAMKRYAPPKENDTAAYIKFLKTQGVDLDKKVGDQVEAMANAIKQFEGWKAGKTDRKNSGGSSSQPSDLFKRISDRVREIQNQEQPQQEKEMNNYKLDGKVGDFEASQPRG